MISKIKCIVVDDEPIARKYLGDYISKMPQLELLATFAKAADAYETIESGQAQLVFLDIQMPGITGIEFIRTLHRKPHIILTTAYSEYALEGYDLNVTDYLLKPVAFERFARAVSKVVAALSQSSGEKAAPVNTDKEQISTTRNFIFVKAGYKSVKVDISDIQ
jgi:DNA-binding LytR/AlgR family response regulator